MDFRRHLELACEVLRRGLIEPSAVAKVVGELSTAGRDAPEAIWSAPNRLSSSDLESVLRAMAETAVEASAPLPSIRGAPGDFRYRKLSVLGVGGMGRVDECLDTRLGRRVAMKRVKPELADRTQATALLEREAKVTGNLEHPNIVPVYDFGDDSVEGPYYVMRIVDHASLSDVIDRLAARDPETFLEFTLARLLRVLSQVCNAIEYAHSRGFAHADLKPANILLGAFGQVHVVDWGIAAALGETPAFFAGTPGYVAPELVDGKQPLDPRSDVFSLGAVLYEVLCQRRAFPHRDTTDLIRAAKQPEIGYRVAPPSGLPCAFEVPDELEQVCLRALAVDPEHRFPTAAALGKAIDQFLEGTLDKERRAQRARELVDVGEGLEQSYHDLTRDRPRRTAELVELRASVPPWAPEAEKQALWDAEDGFAVLETLRVRTLHEVVSTYEQALEAWHGHADARAGLARVYAAELRRA
ncbi:MAG: serine/threonine-protein kinase, partial [Polyangiales bacterium]